MKKIISIVLALLGYSILGCMEKYGVPFTGFQLKGKVCNEQATPIKNIRIIVETNYEPADTLYTSENGNFDRTWTIYEPNGEFKIYVDDIDGDENNGMFVSQNKTIILKETDFNDGKGEWYENPVIKEVNFTLKKQ